jgi:hypothetical protein
MLWRPLRLELPRSLKVALRPSLRLEILGNLSDD